MANPQSPMLRVAHKSARNAFTLVELLVVIAIIGILVALLLPAVQQAREAAQRVQCLNHLKQVGLGYMLHESSQGYFPSGGWSPFSVGDPDRGFGKGQPGGWTYQILPYIEEQAAYDIPKDGDRESVTANQKQQAVQLQNAVVSVFYCPSRREASVYPYVLDNSWTPFNSNKPDTVARNDYGANSGDTTEGSHRFATSWQTQADGTREYSNYQLIWWPKDYFNVDKNPNFKWPPEDGQSGISFYGAEIRITEVKDGTSKTYAVGEKYMNPDFYTDGWGANDNHSAYQGADWDINCWASKKTADRDFSPKQDTPGLDLFGMFGSAHPGGFNVVLCDGSVRSVAYDVDSRVNTFFANREDGQVITE